MDAEQRILNAALKVFASEGYTGATTRRIAKEANVAEVTLFRKFRSKENLLRDVLIKNRAAFSALDPLFIIE
ncbi:MAG: putative DNA-binding transcriptional regulator [Methanomethylovorans sp. PtaU1.Bin093]|jgi:AcrR family transcriptional regulator|nr:helix-turn-helix domain-containing protein [Methanomethylovorans sp. PtaU1.Bin093]OPY19003.1 MAG: putative DNA-binding transcriptional regulator [Methanomethylovorans sp. PtaU1.Bin093]